MFCPQCGSSQNDELKFCKSCGANLHALRQVLATRDADGKFDWSKTWVADMFMSVGEDGSPTVLREPLPLVTPEMKRLREIKAGVITASVGLGLMILLFVLMNGIIAGGRVSDAAAEILSRIWIVGVIPLVVGAALIFNGTFVSKRARLGSGEDDAAAEPESPSASKPETLLPADTNELFPTAFSVTDETTRHLNEPVRRRS